MSVLNDQQVEHAKAQGKEYQQELKNYGQTAEKKLEEAVSYILSLFGTMYSPAIVV